MPSQYDVLIIGGFGHVGLPLGIVLADAGFQVGLLDLNTALRPTIEKGVMPFIEHGAEPIMKRVIGKNLHVCDGIADVAKAKTIIITIGTPVDEYLSPVIKPLFTLADTLLPHLTKDHCLVLRSTVYPGTTRALLEHFRKNGKDVHLSNCPERIVQGFAIQELKELPQVISGCTPEAVTMAGNLFQKLGVETIEVGVEEAECTKLFLNAWRYMQFAAANQFYTFATERGLDYAKIHHAMTHHYKRGNIPKPGFAAGPCLFKDTMQLAAADRSHFPLGHAAMIVNEGLPSFLVEQLERGGEDLRGKTVGILGMAFKSDIDDTRDSLSFKLRKLLQFKGAEVLCSDEFVKDKSFVLKEELLKKCSIVIVGVPHSVYKGAKVPAKTKIVDLWGVLSS